MTEDEGNDEVSSRGRTTYRVGNVMRWVGPPRRMNIPHRTCANGHTIDLGYPIHSRRMLMRTSKGIVRHLQQDEVLTVDCDTCNGRIFDTKGSGCDNDRMVFSYACIECDFDMCPKCYLSQTPMSVLLDNYRRYVQRLSDHEEQMHSNRNGDSHSSVRCYQTGLAILEPAEPRGIFRDVSHRHNQDHSGGEKEDDSSHVVARRDCGAKSRYNSVRPRYWIQGADRVSTVEYPDPTYFGWRFTGSNELSRVEFFEMDNSEDGEAWTVKLDFYYTTGTVKTVLHHPRQGTTQLFGRGRDLTPELYLAILKNPRAHTNIRYHSHRGNLGF